MPQDKAFSDTQDLAIIMVCSGEYFIESVNNLDQSVSVAESFAVTVYSALLLMGCWVLVLKRNDTL